jgi:MFS family permease
MTSETAGQPQTRFRLGRISFCPEVRATHVWTFLLVSLFSTCMMAAINFLQPFLLTEYLGIPASRQGGVSGDLVFWNEVVIVSLIGIFGSLSDKLGRAAIYAAGFTIMGFGYLMFTHVESVAALTGVRIVFAIGAAAVNAMLATIMADYPDDPSRGKFTGVIGVMTGLGIMMIVFVFSKLPAWLQSPTVTSAEAGQRAFTIVAGVCFVLALIAMAGLKRGGTAPLTKLPLLALLKEGMAAGRLPRVRLSYAAAFVSRGDLAIVGTFLSLWIVNHSVAQGLPTAEALKRAGTIFGVSQGAALLWAPVVGILCDRIDRVKALALALFLASAGYIGLGFIEDPTGLPMILACVLLGVGEISAVISAQALIGEQAPARTRGSVVGAFGIFGALGILIATKCGGYLFDAYSPAAPFVAIGCLNAIIFLLALGTIFAKTRDAQAPTADAHRPDDLSQLEKAGIRTALEH